MDPNPVNFDLKFSDTDELIAFLKKSSIKERIDWRKFWEVISDDYDIIKLNNRFENYVEWKSLSANKNIKWDLNLISEFEDKIWWYGISCNPSVKFTTGLIEKYIDNWTWKGNYGHRKYRFYSPNSLSNNPALPMKKSFLRTHNERIDWRALGLNKAIEVSSEIPSMDYYEENLLYERNIKLLIEFKEFWLYDRSEWHNDSDLLRGREQTSIFDNDSIYWKREELQAAFKKEIKIFNSKYDTCI